MLLHLRIRDFAIIDAAEVDFASGFTAITGETGAGKSILVGALLLAMGARARRDLVRTGAATAQVEALFQIAGQGTIQARLRARNLMGDDPDLLLIRRVVGGRGRSQVFINGQLASLATLVALVRGLVDISGQHEQQSLLLVANHLDILDRFAELEPTRAAYAAAHAQLRRLAAAAQVRRAQDAGAQQQLAQLRQALEAIEEVAPEAGEDEALQREQDRLAHADRLRRGTAAAEEALYGGDGSAFEQVGRTAQTLQGLARIDPCLQEVADSLAAAARDIEDGARRLQRYASRMDVDPARLERVGARLALLRNLARQHGGSLTAVLRRRDELATTLQQLGAGPCAEAEAEAQLRAAQAGVLQLAEALSTRRQAAAARLGQAIEVEVADMELGGATFSVRLRRAEALGPHGLDEVEFLWSANRGELPRPLVRIVSGGELSRLMLAVKGVLRSRDLVSVYVFDEVDTGLGGAAADSIGRKIARVADGHQALTITHLAAIAARADHHLRVRKEAAGASATPSGAGAERLRPRRPRRTISRIEPVVGAARAEEIARMIEGASISPATRRAARAMLARRRSSRRPPRADRCAAESVPL